MLIYVVFGYVCITFVTVMEKTSGVVVSEMRQLLEEVRKELGISKSAICRELGISRASYYRKLEGMTFSVGEFCVIMNMFNYRFMLLPVGAKEIKIV